MQCLELVSLQTPYRRSGRAGSSRTWMVKSASKAYAILPRTGSVGIVPPASKRATADCVIPAADASSAWLHLRATRVLGQQPQARTPVGLPRTHRPHPAPPTGAHESQPKMLTTLEMREPSSAEWLPSSARSNPQCGTPSRRCDVAPWCPDRHRNCGSRRTTTPCLSPAAASSTCCPPRTWTVLPLVNTHTALLDQWILSIGLSCGLPTVG